MLGVGVRSIFWWLVVAVYAVWVLAHIESELPWRLHHFSIGELWLVEFFSVPVVVWSVSEQRPLGVRCSTVRCDMRERPRQVVGVS